MKKIKLPFVKRSEYEKMEHRFLQIDREQNEKHKKELDETLKDIKEILPKLARVELQYREDPRTFRLCVDIDPRMVENVLCHGDDQKWVKWFGEYIGEMAKRELKMINFQRFRNDPFRRG